MAEGGEGQMRSEEDGEGRRSPEEAGERQIWLRRRPRLERTEKVAENRKSLKRGRRKPDKAGEGWRRPEKDG